MPATYKRDAIQFEAAFTSHFQDISIDDALTLEACSLFYCGVLHNDDMFENPETAAWIRSFLPTDDQQRSLLNQQTTDFFNNIRKDEASYNHYCHEYTQFRKAYHTH